MQWELIERAKEELEILEAQHPNKYECLKMDLKAFISGFHGFHSEPTCFSTATRESSSCRKKRRNMNGCEVFVDSNGGGMNKRRCKTDVVLEKAQQCLHKIQHLKNSLRN
ncbi:hypothetical protein CASFOL_005879 [Castilleja foliolosa]|uniref:Uncharacterized protein n=1 Tax=Castilleja foliolosa TaxID=1961234 RepID=A0ABD3E4R5_9LAMI